MQAGLLPLALEIQENLRPKASSPFDNEFAERGSIATRQRKSRHSGAATAELGFLHVAGRKAKPLEDKQ